MVGGGWTVGEGRVGVVGGGGIRGRVGRRLEVAGMPLEGEERGGGWVLG